MDLLSPGTTFASLIGKIVSIINAAIPVLIAAGLVLLFIGIVRYIRHRGEAEQRNLMIWSLVALFVILSVWGILRLACASLVGDSSCASSGFGGFSSSQGPGSGWTTYTIPLGS
jgi:hypothetical protein